MAFCLRCWMLENSCQGLVQTLRSAGACFPFGCVTVPGDDRVQDLQDLSECKQARPAGGGRKSLRVSHAATVEGRV